jgi:transcriptional regulator
MSGRIPGRASDAARKFSRERVKRIRTLYQRGVSQVELARRFSTDQQGISQSSAAVHTNLTAARSPADLVAA